jgi:hypothetical protein
MTAGVATSWTADDEELCVELWAESTDDMSECMRVRARDRNPARAELGSESLT